jgi:hypothetical protein
MNPETMTMQVSKRTFLARSLRIERSGVAERGGYVKIKATDAPRD